MGIAAMVLGIVAVVIGLFPFCGWIALVPALVGLVLGIVDVVLKGKKGLKKGMGIAGIILNAIAIVFIIIWVGVVAAAIAAAGI